MIIRKDDKMTKQEAQQLEIECEKIFSDELGEECLVSKPLIGGLRVSFEENFVNLTKDLNSVSWVKCNGDYDRLKEVIDKIILAIRNNREKFETLMKSYYMRFDD